MLSTGSPIPTTGRANFPSAPPPHPPPPPTLKPSGRSVLLSVLIASYLESLLATTSPVRLHFPLLPRRFLPTFFLTRELPRLFISPIFVGAPSTPSRTSSGSLSLSERRFFKMSHKSATATTSSDLSVYIAAENITRPSPLYDELHAGYDMKRTVCFNCIIGGSCTD